MPWDGAVLGWGGGAEDRGSARRRLREDGGRGLLAEGWAGGSVNSKEGSRGERSGGRAWPEQRAAGGGEWLPMKLVEPLCGPEGAGVLGRWGGGRSTHHTKETGRCPIQES